MEATTALMVLLSCTPGGEDCREMRQAPVYESTEICRQALPGVLRRLSGPDRHVIGRCELAADATALVDPVTTNSIPQGDAELTTVYVTRFGNNGPSTEAYRVPTVE